MRVIDHRQFRLTHKKHRATKWWRIGLIATGGVVSLFVLSNVVMAVLYRNKVLPNYTVAAVPVGNIAFDRLDEEVAVDKLLPVQVTLAKDTTVQHFAPKTLGVTIDWPATRARLKQTRSWVPLFSLVTKHTVPAKLRVDNTVFDARAGGLSVFFSKAAAQEHIIFTGQTFSIAAPEAGYKLNTDVLKMQLVDSLENGKTSLNVPVSVVAAPASTGQLAGQLTALQKQLSAKITFSYGGKTKQLAAGDIGKFYVTSGQSMELSLSAMSQVIAAVAAGLGVAPVNQGDAVSAALYAINKGRAVTFVLASKNTTLYHYCTATKGVDTSALPEFRQKLAAVYGDPHGWNQGGIAFQYVESGCDYTAWLSAPAYMTGFGSICDNYYSCRVGPNVVINYDRWLGATDPWNAAGGSLEDYRVMVINHESGHWLGFAHRTCPGAGQLAPVMQQQSISLQGCTFNPWPTPAEIASL